MACDAAAVATPKWNAADIPDQRGRTVLVTGASSGLGLRASQALAAKGAHVLMGCRNPTKAAAALDEVRASASPDAVVETVSVDLADLASVRACADKLNADETAIDVLINNAGVMAVPYQATADGFEMQLGTNHLGHFALTGLLLGALHRAPAPRVVSVSSQAHRIGKIRFNDLMGERRYRRWRQYGQSKLANLLFTNELGRRAAAAGSPLVSAAAHPGYASTHLQTASAEQEGRGIAKRVFTLGNKIFAQSDAQGALPELYAATEDDVRSGDYFGPDGLFENHGYPERVKGNRRSRNEAVAARLWSVSEELTGVTYAFP
jgi:NAD(P)-dependent dehydrogenase (short-subunit alcohol dehydrogenase family)